MGEIFSKVIPIILLISLGYLIQVKGIMKQSTIDEIKRVVINISLPAILFMTFLEMELRKEYILVIITTFIMLGVFCLIGESLNNIKVIAHPLNPFIASGFAFGLLGLPLYSTVFGAENLGKISILGVGHEAFMWFVYFTALKIRFKNAKFSMSDIKGFLKSPIILSIILGVVFNILSFESWFEKSQLLKGVYETLKYLANLATPLILIIIGFGLKFNEEYMKQSFRFLIIRMSVILTIGYIFKYVIIDRIITPEPLFNYAYFTFLILPPAFSLSIFVGEYSTNEHKEIANNTVVLSTLVSIIIYILFIFFK
ncbi:AEC family transporter [Wukongibacter sp. M2B1]|uniref:AEC family transporter n=1 Tax=Wukongibacter sp. M2B1 TaxID=3088895 RepID=UPI003D7947F4